MAPADAARLLGVATDAPWEEVRAAYRARIRTHHPDRATGSADRAARINEAFRTLEYHRRNPTEPRVAATTASAATPPPPPATGRPPVHDVSDAASRAWREHGRRPPEGLAPPVWRVDAESVLIGAPADEAFRWLLDAAHDIGDLTYVDGSVPILEVLCRFEGEPATSLLVTLQGRMDGTEAFCTAESIEARPAPPTAAVVDLLELALHRRGTPDGGIAAS